MKIIKFNFLKLICLCILSFAATQLSAQEICDNGIDDDNDGLIDLNDADCVCSDLMASSLIPNPSFEEMNCCPNSEAELTCADGWIQASVPTTDYVHECGILGNPFLGFEAPLPFPDGEGAIGFRDGRPNQPNFKEYAGSCLTQAMTVGTEYRLDFFVGFHDAPGSMTFDMAIFGSTACSALPFGGGNPNLGCPTNDVGWVELGAMTVTGENEWKNVIFDFIADQSYEAIVLGPACAANPNIDLNPYFFFDRLVLAESIMFEIPLADISGNICDDNLVLTSSDGMGGSFQWYKDGIAIAGENNQTLSLTNVPGVEGNYEVVVTTDTGCFNGEVYELTVPSYQNAVDASFCEGGSIVIGGQEFTEAGTYELNLTATDGCDSLVTLTLESTAIMTGNLSFESCQGESITVNNETYSTAGSYTQNLTSVDGCDSILTIQYEIFANSSTDLTFQACNGEEVIVNGQSYNMSGQFAQVLQNAAGCDSTLNISIVSSPAVSGTASFSICDGTAIDVNGQSYNLAGSYTQNLTSASGCDSILTISIISSPAVSGTASFSICEGTGIDVNGQNYNQAGSYTQNLTSVTGCDSILNISILSFPNTTSQAQYTICQGDMIELNGETYTQAGAFQQFLTSSGGCDSILNINISVTESAASQLEFYACEEDQVSVNGQSYSDAGTYAQTLTASNGCDSIITITIISTAVCSDCVFFEEFTAASIELTRIDDQQFMLALVENDQVKINLELSSDEFAQFTALYLVDNEVQQHGKKSKVKDLLEGKNDMKSMISQCTWNKNQKFSKAAVNSALPYLSSDLPETMNTKKLDLLYGNLMEQSSNLPIGAQMKIDLR